MKGSTCKHVLANAPTSIVSCSNLGFYCCEIWSRTHVAFINIGNQVIDANVEENEDLQSKGNVKKFIQTT
jgi:hypothetical protein